MRGVITLILIILILYALGMLSKKKEEKVEKAVSKVVGLFSSKQAEESRQVKIGMTVKEIEDLLGKPGNIREIDNKIEYTYKDYRVVFQSGKVIEITYKAH